MTLPPWVQETIRQFEPPKTGKLVLELELYQGGVTRLEIGGIVRVKPTEISDGLPNGKN